MNASHFDTFFDTYKEKLLVSVRTLPQEYAYPIDKAEEVADRIRNAVAAKGICSVAIDSPAFKMTCKAVGINCTYKAIKAYLLQDDVVRL